jgi:hypothetical protein
VLRPDGGKVQSRRRRRLARLIPPPKPAAASHARRLLVPRQTARVRKRRVVVSVHDSNLSSGRLAEEMTLEQTDRREGRGQPAAHILDRVAQFPEQSRQVGIKLEPFVQVLLHLVEFRRRELEFLDRRVPFGRASSSVAFGPARSGEGSVESLVNT